MARIDAAGVATAAAVRVGGGSGACAAREAAGARRAAACGADWAACDGGGAAGATERGTKTSRIASWARAGAAAGAINSRRPSSSRISTVVAAAPRCSSRSCAGADVTTIEIP
ncbi:hypothetical protein F0H33_17810 [Xanthomonas translucens pv. undulosa]|nr:hypothetical protein F0H33_17810 [Xanthomonas translucens pv. undulosa]QEO27826.1 hypothetical protein F0H32_18025 [Xanthomonas translucens pv. undulosa]